MKLNKVLLISMVLCVFLLSLTCVSANNLAGDDNQTLAAESIEAETMTVHEDISAIQEVESSNQMELETNLEDSKLQDVTDEEIIEVDDWSELQYYCGLEDKDYTLKLKENTNYYPIDASDSSYQILVKNNVKIIGNDGAYFGDTSPNPATISYTAIIVADDTGKSINMENVTFKWIGTGYQPDGVFLQMGGNSNTNAFKNCYFTNISTNLGHSSIVYIKRGHVNMTNCTFINCTTDFGCLSVYDPKDDPTGTCTSASMSVTDCYFEGNYARTEPGCINNCGILVVNNSTFYRNSAFWWAGAIHTHGGANTTIYDSDFIDNLAGWNGGALYTYSYLQIYNTRFIGNNCTTNNGGGAIGACKYLHAPYIHIEECLFENNENLCWGLDELSTSGTGRGGAISLMDEGGLEVYNSIFIKNSASIGTAICAINGGLSYGSPDVRIVGNQFINHTRIGDVLDVRVATGSVAEIRDNYYFNNSLVYEKLKLEADDPVNGLVTFHLDARLKNPNSFDADILNRSNFDVYVNGVYRTTVSSTTFTLDLNGDTANVYVVPSISNSKSNVVSAGVPKQYIYVSQSMGDDSNNGLSVDQSVKTLAKAIELASATGNIIIRDGIFGETNLIIDYNLTIAANSNVEITVSGNGFIITNGDVKFENVTFKNCNYGSSIKTRLINQTSSGFLILNGCVFEGNSYKAHVEADGLVECENLMVTNNNDGSFIRANSLTIKSSIFSNNVATYTLYRSLLIYKTQTIKFEAENLTFTGNTVSYGCIDVKKNRATITSCNFIGNTVSSSGRTSGVCTEDSCSVLIESSKFINNTDTGKYAAVIYMNSGTLLIRDSILINNSYENNNGLIINGGDSPLKKLTANNNWWGNTLDNLTKPALKVFPISNALPNGWDPAQSWLILTAYTPNTTIEMDKEIPVQFYFSQIDNEGNITSYDGVKLPSFDLTVTAVNGTCSKSKATVNNGISDIVYFSLNQSSSSSITASFNGIEVTLNFTFVKSTPELSIEADEITVGQNADIVVNVPSDATGNVILKVGDIVETASISNSKATFSIPNIPAGNYSIEANYTGNDKYESTLKTANLVVNKMDSITEISAGSIELNKDVIITITLSNGATGTVDVYVNNVKQTINAGQTYTIRNIQRGNYLIRAVYSGDSQYLPSEDEYYFEVGKFTPVLNVNVPDVVYGDDVVVTVNLNSGATGNVTVTIDGKSVTAPLENSKAVVNISGIEAGTTKYADVFYTGSQDYKNASTTKTFSVAKANLDFVISAENIKLGKDAIVEITLPARSGGTLRISGIKDENKSIPLSGIVKLTYSDLDVGTYTVSAIYSGNNYLTTERSVTFTVSDWNKAQWANEGGDIKHTGKSPYESNVNGEIKWVVSVDEITGNLAIDSEGNIYVTTINGVSSFDNNGNLRWTFESTSAGDYFSGIAISRDVIIAPKASDTLYFINQTTGERYGHANLYQGSSEYSPIVDSNGNIYTSGQGGDGQNPNLVIIPYKIWELGGVPIVIELGDNPVAAPTIINDDLVVVPCETGLKIVDVSSKELISTINGAISNGFATVDAGNIIYSFLGNSIVARSDSGSYIWSQEVSGGVGKQLFLDPEIGIYSVNANGELYVYDLIDGSEFKFCDLNVTSGILIGNDNNLYFASEDSFYAFDCDGEILWKAKLGSEIIGTPVMDNNGVIYVNTLNEVYALKYADLKDPGLEISSENIQIGDNETITISLNENATGTVSFVVNGKTYIEDVTDGNIVKVISDLPAKTYITSVTYSGDMRYSETTQSATFIVSKLNPQMNVTTKNIKYGENAVFNVSLPSDATGTVSVSVSGKSGSSSLSNGKATIIISGLTKGDYSYTVTYAGNNKYASDTKTSTISVDKTKTNFTVTPINSINVDDNAQFVVNGLPSDAAGTITVNVDGKSGSSVVSNGGTTINIKMTAEGTYTAEISYSNDDNYMADSQSIVFNVNKIQPTMTVNVNNINVGDNAVFTVSGLPSDASGSVNVAVDGLLYSGTVSNGQAIISIPGLTEGNKIATITYLGDYKYQSINASKTFNVNKVAPTFVVNFNETIYVGDNVEFIISLNPDASGNVTVEVDGKTGTGSVVNGQSTILITSFLEGVKTPVISYSGDDKYYSASYSSKNITVIKKNIDIQVSPIGELYIGQDLTFDIILTSGIGGNVNVVLGDVFNQTYSAKSRVQVTIPNLTYGAKEINISYTGDSKYNPNTTVVEFNVSKIPTTLSADNLVMTYRDGSAWEVTLTDANGDPISNVNVKIGIVGNVYTVKTDANGVARLTINLSPGSCRVTATFEGNDRYNSSFIQSTVTINKIKLFLSASDLYMSYRDGSAWEVTLTDSNGNPISNVKVDIGIVGRVYSISTDADGIARLTINLSPGSCNVNASVSDSKYEADLITAKIYIDSKAKVFLSASDLYMSYRDGSAWEVTLTDANGNPISNVKVDIGIVGRVYSIKTDANGIARLPINLSPGSYDVNASVSDSKYEADLIDAKVNVDSKAKVFLSASDLIMGYRDGSAWTVIVNDRNGNPINNVYVDVGINGKINKIRTNDNGIAKLTINLAAGTYHINASLSNSKYKSDVINSTITVYKYNPILLGNDIVMDYKDGTIYSVTLLDNKGNAIANTIVKITVKGKTYNRKTDANGVASLPINLAVGNHTISVKYDGNSSLNSVEITNNIVVKKPVILIAANDVNMVYKDGTSYAVQLIDDEGNPVAKANEIVNITLKGKTYSRKTNADGIATLPINLAAGTYTVAAEYDGNTITNTIIVNKA